METLQQDAKQTHFPTYNEALAAYPDCDHVVTVGPCWGIEPPLGGLFAPIGGDGYYCGDDQRMPVMGNDAYIVADKPTKKPIYTKEMHEAGELPPVGSKFMLAKKVNCKRIDEFQGLECTVIGHCKSLDGNSVITFSEKMRGICCMNHLPEFIKPIDTRTDEEKLIDDLAEWLELVDRIGFSYKTKASNVSAWLQDKGYRKP